MWQIIESRPFSQIIDVLMVFFNLDPRFHIPQFESHLSWHLHMRCSPQRPSAAFLRSHGLGKHLPLTASVLLLPPGNGHGVPKNTAAESFHGSWRCAWCGYVLRSSLLWPAVHLTSRCPRPGLKKWAQILWPTYGQPLKAKSKTMQRPSIFAPQLSGWNTTTRLGIARDFHLEDIRIKSAALAQCPYRLIKNCGGWVSTAWLISSELVFSNKFLLYWSTHFQLPGFLPHLLPAPPAPRSPLPSPFLWKMGGATWRVEQTDGPSNSWGQLDWQITTRALLSPKRII